MTRTSTLHTAVRILGLLISGSLLYAANITEGKSVTLNGTFGVLRVGSVFSPGTLAPAASVVDGVLLPEGSLWNENTVWWDNDSSVQNDPAYIEINLSGLFTVDSILIQADDNDQYSIHYRTVDGQWIEGGAFATAFDPGLATRGPYDVPFWEATAFRIYGFAGDDYHSVSEFQAFGSSAVPEPSTAALVALAIAGLASIRKARTR